MSRVSELEQELRDIRELQIHILPIHIELQLERREREIVNELCYRASEEMREQREALRKVKLIREALDNGLTVHIYDTGITLEHRPNDESIVYYKGDTLDEAWERWEQRLEEEHLGWKDEPDGGDVFLMPPDNTPLSDVPMWIYTNKVQYAKRQSLIRRIVCAIKGFFHPIKFEEFKDD